MKIIFTVSNDLVSDQRMQRICRSLSDEGYDCLLVGRKLKNSSELKPEKYLQKRIKLFFTKGKLFYLELNFRLFFYLLFSKMDAICSIDCDTAMPGIWVSKIRNKKFIFDAHELFTEVPEVANRKLVKGIWEFVQKRAFKHADLTYTVGNKLAEYFTEKYKREVFCVMNASVLKANIQNIESKARVILYQGALNEGRGIENMIRAMVHIEAEFLIVGDGYLRPVIEALIEEYKVKDKVTLHGFVAPDKLPEITSSAYIGLNVSENISMSYYYSMNNKFFDYIHAALPSLINDFPEYIEMNSKFEVGLITKPGVEALVENANKLLNNEQLHKQLQANCIAASKVWNWQEESKKLVHLYTQQFNTTPLEK